MSDWVVVGAAAVTGGSTLGAVLVTARSQLRSIREELAQTRREAREQQRLSVYREFVNSARSFEHFMNAIPWKPHDEGVSARAVMGEMSQHLQDFHSAQGDLLLFATDQIANESGDLELFAYELELAILDIEPSTQNPWDECWRRWSDLGSDARWSSSLGLVINAMRQDVQADLGPLTTLRPSGNQPREMTDYERTLLDKLGLEAFVEEGKLEIRRSAE